MRTNKVLLVLVGLTVVMQGIVIFQQFSRNSTRQSVTSNAPEQVRDASPGTTVSTLGMPVRGGAGAGILIMEFSDYECPFCERHAAGVGKELEEQWIESGKAKHAFVNLPLSNHKHAILLATAAICAGEQNHYWDMHRQIFETRTRNKDQLMAIAREIGLDDKSFERCMANETIRPEITRDEGIASKLGLQGTPSFALGRWDKDRELVQVERLIIGAVPLRVFKEELDKLIAQLQRDQ